MNDSGIDDPEYMARVQFSAAGGDKMTPELLSHRKTNMTPQQIKELREEWGKYLRSPQSIGKDNSFEGLAADYWLNKISQELEKEREGMREQAVQALDNAQDEITAKAEYFDDDKVLKFVFNAIENEKQDFLSLLSNPLNK